MNASLNRSLLLAAGAAGAYVAGRKLLGRWPPYDFRDRVVVITGGSRGLGLVIARQLAAEGARLVIGARDEDELQQAAGELRQRGAQVVALPCDLEQPRQIDEFFQAARQSFGPVDVLINNAGIIQVGPIETMTTEDYERAMAIHFWAPLHAMRNVLPEMRSRRQGRIVNISSIGGKIAVPHLVPYCASKFALVGLSQGLRAELAKQGIAVTTICPGLMRTGSPLHAWFKGQHRAEYAWFSISDSLPGLSMNAERAAHEIIEACREGRAELTLSTPAKLGTLLAALAPELTADLLSLAGRMLPAEGGIGTAAAEGAGSASGWAPSWLTTLTQRAAERNNQLPSPKLSR